MSAAIVIIQTNRLWVLIDLSYIMEHAYRMTTGEIMYKDFFVPYPPGTFLIQKVLISFFGLTLYPQIIYCCIITILTYIITYRILTFINSDYVLNFFISLPVALTGGYGIWNQPFYDPDYAFFVLLASMVILYAYNKNFPVFHTILSGALTVIPAFFKQNTGLVFIIAVNGIFILSVIFSSKKISIKNYLLFFSGCMLMAIILILYIHLIFGLNNFIYNIFTVPSLVRLPEPMKFIKMFVNYLAIRNTIILFLIYALIRFISISEKKKIAGGIFLALLPFYIIPAFRYFILNKYFIDQFMTIWPSVILISAAAFIYALRKRNDIPLFIRFFLLIFLGVSASAFLSQGYWSSTYALWPVLIIIISFVFLFIDSVAYHKIYRYIFISASVALTITMGVFISLNILRTGADNFDDAGSIQYSETISGLALPGEYMNNFDELVKFTDYEIPKNEPLMLLPHEDPYFWASDRKPLFSLYMFDWTLYLNNVDNILDKMKTDGVKWILIKTKLQLKGLTSFKDIDKLILKIQENYKLYKKLQGYDIYTVK